VTTEQFYKAAAQFNEKAAGKIWPVALLPWWVRGIDPLSHAFVDAVAGYQRAHGLDVDGKLGGDTWGAIVATEHVREPDVTQAAPRFEPCLGDRYAYRPTARVEKARTKPVKGLGLHTTGIGIFNAATKRGISVRAVLDSLISQPSAYSPNAYVVPGGDVIVVVPPNEQALHGGYGSTRALYAQGFEAWSRYVGNGGAESVRPGAKPGRYDAWAALAKRYGFKSPLELTADPNNELYAVDLVPVYADGIKGEHYDDAQIDRLAEIAVWAAGRFGFPLAFPRVLQHMHWNPLTRWAWDVGGDFSFARLGAAIRARGVDVKLGAGDD